jgi:hypothetical protein
MNPFRKLTAVVSLLALLFVAMPAFATQTPLTPAALKLNNYAVQAGDLTVSFAACDATNGNSFAVTGQEIFLVQNSGASAYTFTISSVADNFGRLDTSLTNYSVAASGITAIELKYLLGWAQTGQVMVTTCSNVALKFAIVRFQ